MEELYTQLTEFTQDNFPAVVGTVAAVGTITVFTVMKSAKKMSRSHGMFQDTVGGSARILSNSDSILKKEEVKNSVEEYDALFKGAREATGAITSDESVKKREKEYKTMVNHFYDLVTDFYEWGWGQSFHFGPRWENEEFHASLARAEYHLCSRLGMKPGMKVLDVGCGVGGPMRTIARFSGSHVKGITINEYQVKVGNKYNKAKGLGDLCELVQGDFQKLPWKAGDFDAAYEIEATCHSPDKVQTFSEVNRVLKMGGLFAGYEWVVCNKYDPKNPRHVQLKEGIEVGNGLPTLATPEKVVEAMEKAGFEVLDHYDANRNVHSEQEIPWYDTLNGKMTLSGFRMTKLGRQCTHAMVTVLEALRIAPKGSVRVSEILNATAVDLVESGKAEIFTPSYFFIGRKVREV